MKKAKKWIRRIFNLYNLSIVISICVIMISLGIIFRSNIQTGLNTISSALINVKDAAVSAFKNAGDAVALKIKEITYQPEEKDFNGVKVVASGKTEDEEITEDEAREMAVKQFERLGEKVEKDSLKVSQLKRSDNIYYFISSEENTLEVSIKGGIIRRINAVVVK